MPAVNASRASLVAQKVKNPSAVQGRPRFDSWVEKIPWRREWQPSPGFLPGKFHAQTKESDMAERLSLHFTSNTSKNFFTQMQYS